MPANPLVRLSLRARVGGVTAVAVLATALGLGAAPLASASPAAPAAIRIAAGVPVLKVAATYKGVPYRWGGTTTHGFDCSGYVQFVFRKLGVKLPRTAEAQYEATKHITRSQLQPGDLVFYGRPGGVYHVGIYAGHGMFWDAPHTGDRVRLQTIWAGAKVYGRVRGLPGTLTVAPSAVAPGVVLPVVIAVTPPLVAPTTAAPAPTDPATPAASPTASADAGAAAATPTPSATTASTAATPSLTG